MFAFSGCNGAGIVGTGREKSTFVSGGAFFPLGGGENRLRLSYSMPSVERIREEIRRLARLLQ